MVLQLASTNTLNVLGESWAVQIKIITKEAELHYQEIFRSELNMENLTRRRNNFTVIRVIKAVQTKIVDIICQGNLYFRYTGN